MIVIGLTGGIGMGKSTVAKMFVRLGVPAFNADEAVHRLQAPNGLAIPALARAFPATVNHGILDRSALREIVFANHHAMRQLEGIMHPLVHRQETLFRAAAYRAGKRAVLLDIPLLFETGSENRVHKTITVSAPRAVQLARVKKRGLDAMQIKAIIATQMPDAEKRIRADYVINTGLSKFETRRAVCRLIKEILV